MLIVSTLIMFDSDNSIIVCFNLKVPLRISIFLFLLFLLQYLYFVDITFNISMFSEGLYSVLNFQFLVGFYIILAPICYTKWPFL